MSLQKQSVVKLTHLLGLNVRVKYLVKIAGNLLVDKIINPSILKVREDKCGGIA